MGIIDQIKSRVAEVLDPEGRHNAVVEGIEALLEQNGGLPGTLQKLHDNGLGEEVRSWVGTGENLPVTSEKVESTFGAGAIDSLAAKVGVPTSALKQGIARFLPIVVDHLTPDGQVPTEPVQRAGIVKALMDAVTHKAA